MATKFPDIVGADRGFHTSGDLIDRTIDGVPFNQLWDQLNAARKEFNAGFQPMIAGLITKTINYRDVIPLDGGSMDFEPASEFGVPEAGRVEPETYSIGYPLTWYDLATRFTVAFLRDADAAQVAAQANAAFDAADRLTYALAMRALLTPKQVGSRRSNKEGIDVYSLYAGGSDDTPPMFAGRTFSSGHSHYMTSGATTVDADDLDRLITNITEHGIGINPGEQVVVVVHPTEAKVIQGFRVATGAPFDFIPSAAAPAYITNERVVGQTPGTTFQGLDVIGSFGKALIVMSYFVPEHFMVAYATSGANSAKNVLALRQHQTPTQRGVLLYPGNVNSNYPLLESNFALGVGIGVKNRGAGAVMQITASGTYTAPTLAQLPVAVNPTV